MLHLQDALVTTVKLFFRFDYDADLHLFVHAAQFRQNNATDYVSAETENELHWHTAH
jgi:hypothetical protein